MKIYRVPAKCREKGCKYIGTLRDVEKRGVNLKVPCEIRGVNLQFGKIYLPKNVFSVKSIGTFCK